MEPIKQITEDALKNNISNENKQNSKIRMIIWTGPCIDTEKKTIYQSQGYYKDTHTVLACSKSQYKAFKQGRYTFQVDDLRETERLLNQDQSALIEYFNRNPKIVKEPLKVNEEEAKILLDKHSKPMIESLTFFLTNVYLCKLAPNALYNVAGGVIDPTFYEIECDLIRDGVPDTNNAYVVHNPFIRRQTIHTVPRGGGQKLSEYRANLISFNVGNLEESGRGMNLLVNNQYGNPYCFAFEPDTSIDGDLWFEGLKSSLSHGVYEFWADNIGGGPMLRASRKSVYQAAARYYKDINPTNLRYNGYRVNPLATSFSSNAITPVKVYIEDIFGDPNFYAGIIAVLSQLLNGIDGDRSKDLNKKLDLGTLDYNQFYKDKLGQPI